MKGTTQSVVMKKQVYCKITWHVTEVIWNCSVSSDLCFWSTFSWREQHVLVGMLTCTVFVKFTFKELLNGGHRNNLLVELIGLCVCPLLVACECRSLCVECWVILPISDSLVLPSSKAYPVPHPCLLPVLWTREYRRASVQQRTSLMNKYLLSFLSFIWRE